MKSKEDLEDLACFLDWQAQRRCHSKSKRAGYCSAAEMLWWITGHMDHPMLDEMLKLAVVNRPTLHLKSRKKITTEDAFAI